MQMSTMPWPKPTLLITCAILAYCGASCADDSGTDLPYKLTIGSHRFTESGNGVDINLRNSSTAGTTWLGYFDADGLNAHQLRAGWDHSYGDSFRLSPSLQFASGGFVGGSINFETGKTWFVGAGYGRTNLLPYFNLNFDPNDAWNLNGGYRAVDGVSYALSYTRDDRLNPDQQHLHAVYRTRVNSADRLTLDVLFKRGLINGEIINRVGTTVTYDWPRIFVRLAFDPNTNFTSDDAVRLSLGSRF